MSNLWSNQHEFQGVSAFRAFLGTPMEKQTFPATFFWLSDGEDFEPVRLASFCTWSDVRRGKAGRSPEFHLYYSAESGRVRLAAETLLEEARDEALAEQQRRVAEGALNRLYTIVKGDAV